MNDNTDEALIALLQRLGEFQPTADSTFRALQRVRVALEAPTSRRRVMRKRFVIAAVVLLAAGSVFAWLMPSSARFGEIQAAMNKARSVSCRQIIRTPGKPDETSRIRVLESGLWRFDSGDGSYAIVDTKKSQSLAVDPAKKTALLLLGANVPSINLYEMIKNLPADKKARPLPGKKIDSKKVLGFAVKVNDMDFTVWADPASRLPVRIEASAKEKDTTRELIIDEFQFDKELDPKLFTLEPPAGYKVTKHGTPTMPAAPDDARLRAPVITPLVGVGPVNFGMSREDVEKAFGKPDAVEPMGKRGAVSLNYNSRGVFITVGPKLGVVSISALAQKTIIVRIRDFAGKTDKGIALGASTADVVKAYGEPTSRETNEGSTYLNYNKLQASFTFFDDKLVQMMFNRPR
jgi:outer membrane lipoprotein-sorting protein